ncbi:NAD-dependent epimerase/dehydratase family protein [Chitinimonas sp.]|uniref:NAD-dependent epimerase/dehydratase family protein n=1 Tax=Chitinimonas sp. TaxID=1934313 RepID=UPI0035AF03D9
MPKIALFGACGAIGHSLAAALRSQNRAYRVVGRSRAALQAQFGDDPLAEIVVWNPDDPESVRRAAHGIDTLVYLVGVDYWRFELHPQLMEKTLAGAVAEGVSRLLLIGTVYPYGRVGSAPISEQQARHPHTFKGRMRKAQEDLLLAAHAAGAIQACILRLPDFYGPGLDKSFLGGAFAAAAKHGTAALIGPLDRPHQFVFVPDVGPLIIKLLAQPQAFGHSWHYAGSGSSSQQAIIDEIERQSGRVLKRRVIGKTLLRLLGLFNPMLREMVEMHYLLTEPVIMDDSALAQLIGPLPRTDYPSGIRQCLQAVGQSQQEGEQGKANHA